MLARRRKSFVDEFVGWIRQNETNLTEGDIATVRAYLLRLTTEHRHGDAARPWFMHVAPRQMMEDHLLIAGLAELCFKENVVALGCNSAMQFEGTINGKGGGKDVHLLAGRVEDAVLRGWTNRSYGVAMIIPVNMDQIHWEAIFCRCEGPSKT